MNYRKWRVVGNCHYIDCPYPRWRPLDGRGRTTHKCRQACKYYRGVTEDSVMCDWDPDMKMTRVAMPRKRPKREVVKTEA